MIPFDLEIDASGLNCPLPLLRLKKGLTQINTGEVVKIIATDPAAHLDIGVYTQQTGHSIIESIKEDKSHIFYIEKKAKAD
ncbi:MAG: sulfurtransferase TusA family protein [Methylococcales bacterium]|nr:sulfurtransferase TusA family protein [Methylococcales bacterium]